MPSALPNFSTTEDSLPDFSTPDLPNFGPEIKSSPVNQPSMFSSGLPPGTPISENPDWAFTQTMAAQGLPKVVEPVHRVLAYAGNVARSIPADVAQTVHGDEKYWELHNLAAAALGVEMPIDEALSEASKDSKTWATVGKISQGIAGTAPMAALGGLPAAAQKLVLAGFTAKMLADVPDIATKLGDELGKPVDKQDPNKISDLVSEGVQAVGFSVAGALAMRSTIKPEVSEPFVDRTAPESGMSRDAAMPPASREAPAPSTQLPISVPVRVSPAPATPLNLPAPTDRPQIEGDQLTMPAGAEPGRLPNFSLTPLTDQALQTIKETDATSSITSGEGLDLRQQGQGLGDPTSLQQQGETSGAQEQGTPGGAPQTSTTEADVIGKEIGYEFKGTQAGAAVGKVPDTATPEEKAMYAEIARQQGNQWEFTNPKTGMTFYVPEGSSRETILEASKSKEPSPPEIIGMGGATPSELPGAGDASVTGLAERVRAERAASGHADVVPPGEGIAPADSVQRGRELVSKGVDPEETLRLFERTKSFSADDIAVVRARSEELARATNKAEETFGTDSQEFRDAYKTESDWAARTKVMQTEWAKAGHAQQGEVDIDTGTFSGLARAFKEDTGKDFTPEQTGEAKVRAKKVSKAGEAVDAVRKKLYGYLFKDYRSIAEAEKAAQAAVWKVIREHAVREAERERKANVEAVVAKQELSDVQKNEAIRVQKIIDQVKRDAVIASRKAEIERRIKDASRPQEIRDVQQKAAQKAQDSIDALHRRNLLKSLGDETKARVEEAQKKLDAANAERKLAAQSAKEAHKRASDAAIKGAKAEVAERVARADTANYVWTKAKEYIDAGMDDFNDVVNKLATDLGMSTDKIRAAMAKDKRAKFIVDDLFRKQQTLRDLKAQAKMWLKQTQVPALNRVLQSIPRIMFAAKVGFHGTVALGTHAPMLVFQPLHWKNYFQNYSKMFKMVGSKSFYEGQIQDLIRRPNYITARRAGLVNDPFTFEDFNNPKITAFLGKFTGMGNRGYTVLKLIRQDLFDQKWNSLPRVVQTEPGMAEAIADGINHVTGVVKGSSPRGASVMLFAPRLEASRAMWLAGDPLRALSALTNWKNATEAEKMFAISQVKEKAWVLGTLYGLLAVNQGMLSATGSGQSVNFTDATKSDFLKFKMAGDNVSYGNPMLNMARLPVRLWDIGSGDGGKLKHLIYPDENMGSVLMDYARTQLSPFASLGADLITKGDFENRPLPQIPGYGKPIPMPKRLAARGATPYTWTEYITSRALPIPAEEAVKEVWKSGMGMDEEHVKLMLRTLGKISLMAATGTRISKDYSPQVQPAPAQLPNF